MARIVCVPPHLGTNENDNTVSKLRSKNLLTGNLSIVQEDMSFPGNVRRQGKD